MRQALRRTVVYFNPRTSCEVRLYTSETHLFVPFYFNPRTSCEVRLRAILRGAHPDIISIHAPRVRCDDIFSISSSVSVIISIHAPRVRCDINICHYYHICHIISIHAPRVRCDLYPLSAISDSTVFQSTHLV